MKSTPPVTKSPDKVEKVRKEDQAAREHDGREDARSRGAGTARSRDPFGPGDDRRERAAENIDVGMTRRSD